MITKKQVKFEKTVEDFRNRPQKTEDEPKHIISKVTYNLWIRWCQREWLGPDVEVRAGGWNTHVSCIPFRSHVS